MNQRYNLGEGIETTKADDDSLVERARQAVNEGDMSMLPVLEWDERGRKGKSDGTKFHKVARNKVMKLFEYHNAEKISELLDTYKYVLYRIKAYDYRDVPDKLAKRIAKTDITNWLESTVQEDSKEDIERYEKCVSVLWKEYNESNKTYPQMAKKYDINKDILYRAVRKKYDKPHQAILNKSNQILNQ